jgi:molybdenum cofactor cytidylyltransferase
MMRVAVAILAAGQAARFGRQKLLEAWRGRPLLDHALCAASEASAGDVLLVTGEDRYTHLAALYAAHVVHNPRSADGMGTSIAAAARACDENIDALMIVLGDQPLVTAEHLRALVAAWDGEEGGIVATSYAETMGPPVLFARAYFDELAMLDDDSGARRVLRANAERVRTVRYEPAAFDVDTPDDLAGLDQAKL